MYRVTAILLLVVSFKAFPQHNIIGQNVEKRLCICFYEDSENISLSYSQDTSFVAFNIIIEGFETEELREKARREEKEKHKSSLLLTYSEPLFVKVYLSDDSRSITGGREESLSVCKSIVSLNEFRNMNFKPPEGTSDSRVYFITEIEDDLYKRWNAIVDANE